MANTYTLIYKSILTSNQSSVVFSSIPSTYTDLVLVANYGISNAGYTFGVQFNSDTGTNYSFTYLRGNGSSTLSYRKANMVFAAFCDEVSANNNNTAIVHFQNYSNSSTYKTFITRTGNADRSTNTAVGLWRSTSAITSMVIKEAADGGSGTFGTGNIASGSTFTIYGIKAA